MSGRQKGKMQSITHKETLGEINDWLQKNKGYKYYFLWIFGCNTGLRISDLIKIKVNDVRDKECFVIITQKTKRKIEVTLNPYIQEEIRKYINDKNDDEYLFQSRKGENKPITRQMASTVIKELAADLKLERVNSHSMRKTFGYWHYKEYRNIHYLMNLFGHKTEAQTLEYIGFKSNEANVSKVDD